MDKYIEPEFTFPQRKQFKIRSKERRDAHMEIQCHVANMEDRINIQKEFKKAIRRMDHLFGCKFSYELTVISGQHYLKI